MNKRLTQKSRFLSLVLRHQPEKAGIELDDAGWVEVTKLRAGLAEAGHPLTLEELQTLVRENDKQRFAFSSDGSRIRANQGHSVQVDLALAKATPPSSLYHGTVERFLASIQEQGLRPGDRHHVHLSADRATAWKVAQRRGAPIILLIDAQQMAQRGHDFYRSENGVWLTDHVPAEFLTRLQQFGEASG